MPISVLPQRDALDVGSGRLYVGGTWRDGQGDEVLPHVHPSTNEEVVSIAAGTAGDVDAAVRAARRAFDAGPWPHLKARERRRLLQPLVDLIRRHSAELSRLQTLDNGVPISFSSAYRISGEFVADLIDHYFGWIDKLTGETYPQFTEAVPIQFMSFRRPIGVVAAITPWNGPLLQFANKVGPALAAGNAVVVKPSEFASLTTLRLAELIEQLELPEGVFNLVTGRGSVVGAALVDHPGVDKVTFTGSRAVGEAVMESCARGVRGVVLELGGKSPSIVFPDADVGAAANSVMRVLAHGLSGQVCSSQSRAIVHHEVVDEFVAGCRAVAGSVRFGDPFDQATTSAPMINPAQLTRVVDFVEAGVAEGAELVFGGDRPAGNGLDQGNWINPALFTGVDNGMSIAQEEIFGPVLCVIPFRTEQEGVELANQTRYGLSAGLYTVDAARAMRVSRSLRCGTVGVNAYSFMPNSPVGGFKESGLGREGGRTGLEEFTEVQTVMFDLEDKS